MVIVDTRSAEVIETRNGFQLSSAAKLPLIKNQQKEIDTLTKELKKLNGTKKKLEKQLKTKN